MAISGDSFARQMLALLARSGTAEAYWAAASDARQRILEAEGAALEAANNRRVGWNTAYSYARDVRKKYERAEKDAQAAQAAAREGKARAVAVEGLLRSLRQEGKREREGMLRPPRDDADAA